MLASGRFFNLEQHLMFILLKNFSAQIHKKNLQPSQYHDDQKIDCYVC